MWGGSMFPQALMNLGLIDEYRINLHRVILGSGKPLFTDITSKIRLSLLSAETFETGTVGFCYRPEK
jgi:dihydrofolate reductase